MGTLFSISNNGIVTLSPLSASTALALDGSKNIVSSATTSTELGYLSGVTSAIQTQLNAKQASGNYLTALTGDGTAAGPGSSAITLSTVNSNVGSFGSASSVANFTVNGKGLVTAAASTSIQISESQVTNLVSDLAGKQATGNYITGTTGDVVATGPGSVAATIQSGVVTGAKIAANTITNSNINSAADIDPTKLGAFTNGARALTTNSVSKKIQESTVTATELGYLSGVTSAIQTQLDAKQATGNYITALTGDVTATGPGSVAGTIASGVVTNAKLATMASHTFKGNNTGSTAAPLDLTITQMLSELSLNITASRVPYGNGSSGLTSSSTFVFDGTNLGVGTASPHAPLQFGQVLASRKIVLWETANNDHQFYGFGANNSAVEFHIDGTGASYVFYAAASSSASTALFSISGTGTVRVNGLNSVGIVHTDSSGNFSTSTIVAADISANAVTNAKLDTMTNNTIKGNVSGSTAAPSDLSAANVRAMLGDSVGTWAPTVGDGTNNFSLSTALGHYTILQNTVFYTIHVIWSSKGSATGNMRVSLPFASLSTTNYRGSANVGWSTGLVWTQAVKDCFPIASLDNNVSYINIGSEASDGTSTVNVACSAAASTGDMQISGFYRTA